MSTIADVIHMGSSDSPNNYPTCCGKSPDQEMDWLGYLARHLLDAKKRWAEFKIMQELGRHSSLRSTIDIYAQAVTPTKRDAQAVVLSLLFPVDPHQTSIAEHEGTQPPDC
jgi:hypothetical protein